MTEPRPSPNSQAFPSHFKSQSDQELIRLALHKSPFFSALDEEQVDRFVAVAERKDYKAGEIVILEGCIDQGENDDAGETVSREASAPMDPAGPAESDEYMLAEEEEEEDTKSPEIHMQKMTTDSDELHSGRSSPAATTMSEGGTSGPVIDKSSDDATAANATDNNDETGSAKEPSMNEISSGRSTSDSSSNNEPPPPTSAVKRSVYIVQSGTADVWYQPHFRPASLQACTVFGEGGFLFRRQHSASVLAGNQGLSCFVVDFDTFCRHVLPASSRLRQLFDDGAQQSDEDEEKFMTIQDFGRIAHSSLPQDPLVGLWIANSYSWLVTSRRQRPSQKLAPRIYLPDFCFFHLLMARPDPEVDIAFLLMDERRTGQVYLSDVAKFVEPVFSDIDLSSHFFTRYFGTDGQKSIRQVHFSQFLLDLQREIGKQAFLRSVEQKGTSEGYLNPLDFIHVLKTACGWRLPQTVADRLEATYNRPFPSEAIRDTASRDTKNNQSDLRTRFFAYGDFLAFQEVLGNLSAICSLIDSASEIKKGPISSEDFKVANRVLGVGGRLSRRQVEIVFSLFDLDGDGYISPADTVQVCGVNLSQRLREQDGKLTIAPSPSLEKGTSDKSGSFEKQGTLHQLRNFVQQFGLTATASSVGVLLLYPLDLVKTRLMNERVPLGENGNYKGWIDCLQKTWRSEGTLALYRGLTPQLIGVGPEKMIKFTVNDLLRQSLGSLDADASDAKAHKRHRRLNIPLELLAGACAGACQLLVTNPMEISKIRMQLQGETSSLLRAKGLPAPASQSFATVVRDLGFPGVYRGASACLLRDVPFSAIYFASYAGIKEFLLDFLVEKELEPRLTATDILLVGTLAGIPATLITQPADVIKTRLQSIPRPGEVEYTKGIRDCATQIYQQEGWQAFWRGAWPRVLRIAPQFGISLLAYKQLTQWLGLGPHSNSSSPRGGPPTNAPIHPHDYRLIFPTRSAGTG